MIERLALLICGFVALGGCSQRVYEVAQPSNISLDQAMQDVATSLAHLRDFEKANNIQLGVVIDEVNLNFQVAANAQDSTKLAVAVSSPAHAPVVASLNASDETLLAAQRGSTIQVKMKSVITAPLNEVGCFYFIPNYLNSKKDCSSGKPSSSTAPSPPSSQPAQPGHAEATQSLIAAKEMQRDLDAYDLPLKVEAVSYHAQQ